MDLGIDFTAIVRRVRNNSADKPLESLTGAVEAARELERLGDQLVGHFVAEAREAGLSWTQIGTSLGVTRQGARQRFGTPASLDPQAAPMDPDGIRRKSAPFSAVRADGQALDVQVEISGAWYRLASIDGIAAEDLVSAARSHFRARWLKRISEDLDNVFAAMGQKLGDTAEVVLVDAAGRRFNRSVDVTVAKRKAAWRYNNADRA